MTRPLRIEYPGAYYHVMNRGLSHVEVFVEDRDREQFFILIGELTRLWGVRVYAYCLMDTHYHLLLQTPKGELSRAMRHLDGIYTLRFNRSRGRDGPLFRGRYKAILIDAEEYFLAVARYILRRGVSPSASILRYGVLSAPLSSRRTIPEGVHLELSAAKTGIPTQLPAPISTTSSLYNLHSQS